MKCYQCDRGSDTQGEMLPVFVCVSCDQHDRAVIEAAEAWTVCCRNGMVKESIPLANSLADAVEAMQAARGK